MRASECAYSVPLTDWGDDSSTTNYTGNPRHVLSGCQKHVKITSSLVSRSRQIYCTDQTRKSGLIPRWDPARDCLYNRSLPFHTINWEQRAGKIQATTTIQLLLLLASTIEQQLELLRERELNIDLTESSCQENCRGHVWVHFISSHKYTPTRSTHSLPASSSSLFEQGPLEQGRPLASLTAGEGGGGGEGGGADPGLGNFRI